MGLKETITNLLTNQRAMTQSELAESIYGDKNHNSNIYGALTNLVSNGVLLKSKVSPFTYTLSGTDVTNNEMTTRKKKDKRDVSGDVITNKTLEEVESQVAQTVNYGAENDLITRCLARFPYNTDSDLVAMKIGLIDITNSTHLSHYKSVISMVDLSKIIVSITDIDARIRDGDPEVVSEIARSNENINLFSFASKYCCYHNRNFYKKDDYSIFDGVLKEYLPLYFNDITEYRIDKWRTSFNYREYNNYISQKLDELNITVAYRRRKFDHFIWYKNR